MIVTGKIVKIISNLYTVKAQGKLYEARARGKFRNENITPLVGDLCYIDIETNYITEILTRKNSLNRPPVANIDIALILTSVKEPLLSLNLLDKELSCIEGANITPIICLSKMDLLNRKEKKLIMKEMKYYKSIGYNVILNKSKRKLRKLLKDKTVVLTGQTGAGKSTLLNKLGKLNIKTSPISKSLGRGVHTTRHAEIYTVKNIDFVDTPGFSALDIKCKKEELANTFKEFRNVKCKFKECSHIKEPGCIIKDKVSKGEIKQSRYDNYVKFRSEL